jgi:hypothetical protein
MKSRFTKNSKPIKIIILMLSLVLIHCSLLTAQSFKVLAVSDLVRVFEDGYKLPPMYDTVKIFGIRDETISGQCVVNSGSNLTNVTVEVSPLRHLHSGDQLPPSAVEWDFTGSVPLTRNASNQSLTALTRQAPARFPDYLMAEKHMDINKGMYQSIWLTIAIPGTARAGTYLGKVTVKSNQGEQSLPLSVTVYPLTMPAERHLKVAEWYNTRNFARFHGIQEEYSDAWFAMLRKYAENMAAHRQNVFQVPMSAIEIRRSKDGALEFDFTRFDQIAQVFWNTGKMDYLETGELAKFKENWHSTEIVLKDFNVTDIESNEKIIVPGKDVMPYLLPSFEGHLRKKGWLNKTLFHVKDEPTLHNAQSWLEMSRYIHRYAPDLTRIDAMNNPIILDELEIGVSMLDNLDILYKGFSKKQREGTELWFYTTGLFQATSYPNKTIDVPLIGSRLMHWLNYRYDISGYLHWGWNQWSENPFEEVGQHIGDGWHVYPAKDGVLNSLRWEQMRNGIQDYEYFRLLENRIKDLKDSLGTRFGWIDPTHRGKEIAGGAVMSFHEHTQDPDVLYNAKTKVIGELLDFDTSPKTYVQVHPYENSVLKSRSGVEVYGWTEPGTKITINGENIPVGKEGLFMKWLPLYPRSNTVTVRASNASGSKEIIRQYNVVP